MIDEAVWTRIVFELEALDVDVNFAAADKLRAETTVDDVPRLLALLATGRDFFVREAAAWPLAELAGPSALRELFVAYQKGFDEGHDNDGFTAALLEIPALFPAGVKIALRALATKESGAILSHTRWLLEFCE